MNNIAKPTDETDAYCDLRKFTEYVFTNTEESKGKVNVFKDWGFEIGNSAYLKYEFETQAKEKYLSGDYVLGVLNEYGQRITVEITLTTEAQGSKIFKSGWMIHPLGRITCNTPFTGYVK